MTTRTDLDTPPGAAASPRRHLFRGGIASLLALAFTRQAAAAAPPAAGDRHPGFADEMLDRVAITDLIMRERWARETHAPDVAAACYHPEARVEVSWFKGTAAEFVELGKRRPPEGVVNFDGMSPPVIWVRGQRAIADTACAVHTHLVMDGVEVSAVSHTRLLWRAQVLDGRWLIAGLRGIYIRDTLQTAGPGQPLRLDPVRLARYRPSYRHLSYVLETTGRKPLDDLAGIDRPDLVEALRAAERAWLEQG